MQVVLMVVDDVFVFAVCVYSEVHRGAVIIQMCTNITPSIWIMSVRHAHTIDVPKRPALAVIIF